MITTKNRSNIIINRENSLFVINTTTFLLSIKRKGKHLIFSNVSIKSITYAFLGYNVQVLYL